VNETLTRREQRAQELHATVPEHSEAMDRLRRLIDSCGASGVSDVHVHPDKPARRVDRNQLILDTGPEGTYSVEDIAAWLDVGTLGVPEPLQAKGHAFASFQTDEYRVRATFRKSFAGVTVSFRLIPSVIPSAHDLGMPGSVQKLIHRDSGLIIFYGPTGSGKTTGIASLIKDINTIYDKHIYMVEDPTEFVHTEIGATSIVQRQIGPHALDYPSAIEDALRSKPNVIVIGELLDPATTKAALHAATTGHLVFTTAHAGSTVEALDGFIGQFPANEQPQIRTRLSQSLLAIMVQKLVPAVDGTLTAAREVMINNTNFAELIRTEDTQMIRSQLSGDRGNSFSLEDNLLEMVKDGTITAATAIAAARNPRDLTSELTRAGLNPGLAAVA
jgi:twitching motility protein PilT